jgi:amino acid adenylation domain-containing protein
MSTEQVNSQESGAHANLEDIYELSPLQQGMLFHTLYSPGSGIYFEQSLFTIEGDLDRTAFQRAWQHVVARHSILRTGFVWEGVDKPLQIVYRSVAVGVEEHDWREFDADRQDEMLETFIEEDQKRGFDLARPPLLRLALFRVAQNVYKFLWSRHHLILDRWSRALVLKDFFTFYDAFCKGIEPEIEAARPYGDYIAWLLKQDASAAESYWRRSLQGFENPTDIRLGTKTSSLPQETYKQESVLLSSEVTASLRRFAREQKLTMYTLVQGAWSLLLSRYSGERDVLFGATISGRPADLANVENIVGLFINTLPVRVTIQPQTSLVSWLHALQESQVEQRQYDYSSLIDIQGWSDVPRGVALFETLLVFENLPVETSFRETENNLVMRGDRGVGSKTNYPLAMLVNPGAELSLQAVYDCGRFEADSIHRLLNHFLVLLEQFSDSAESSIAEISLLDEFERDQVLYQWNNTQRSYPRELCVHELIEQRAALEPDKTVVVFGPQQLTYAELNRRANQLASYLRAYLGEESLVGIYLERGPELIIALLAVLKAGAAYVPLGIESPSSRLAFMIEDGGLRLIITQSDLRKRLPDTTAHVVCLQAEAKQIDAQPGVNLPVKANPSSLAYVIYTSGSTGTPKAVEITHTAVVNFLTAMQQQPGLTAADRLLAVTTLSFDIAGLEIYLPLIAGGCLELTSRAEAADGKYLSEKLTHGGITVMQATPATWRLLIDSGWKGNPQLKILCGGEALPRDLANQLLERSKSVWNMYGPTETTIWSAVGELKQMDGPVLLGEAINNTQLYVLDEELNPAPLGVPGELFIGGDGLARGYRAQGALTAERFIPDLFAAKAGARLYRTGDLVRRLGNGRLEFLGRLDHQVKIRGFRIETAEIEWSLRQHPAVREAVVIASEAGPGEKRLVGYLVLRPDRTITVDDLRKHLQQSLPEYMIPSAFVILDKLPLTMSGKVDRRQLPAPDGSRPQLEEKYLAPQTPLEQEIANIWEQVLKVKGVGAHDNFFALGGHSLLATQVISRVNELLQVEMPLRDLFEQPTVAGFALATAQRQALMTEDETRQLLGKLSELTDEEAQQLLDSGNFPGI